MTTDTYLIDTSAAFRAGYISRVRRRIRILTRSRRRATCVVVDLEMLYGARSPGDYERLRYARRFAYEVLPIDGRVEDRAREVQAQLARNSQHRTTGPADLLIAACAEVNGATLVHYDSDFDAIAAVTGQPTEWVVPRGTVP
jgi:predicted nucleic acid-binding protein